MRSPRLKVTYCSAVYHCTSRIVGGEFLLTALEKERLHKIATVQADFCGVELPTYSFMSNHLHMVVRVPAPHPISDQEIARRVRVLYPKTHPIAIAVEQDLEQTQKIADPLRQRLLARMGDISMYVKEVKQRFTRYFNRTHERFGTVWAERFKSSLIEDAPRPVVWVASYVDLNGVRAKLAKTAEGYRFCGYAEAVAVDGRAREMLGRYLPGQTWAEKNRYYQEYLIIKCAADEPNQTEPTRQQLLARLKKEGALPSNLRLRLRIRYFTDGAVLGSRAFVDEVYHRFRSHFGIRRKAGAHPMQGGDWDGMMVLRNLKKNVFS